MRAGRFLQLARYLWPAPCTAVGLGFGALAVALGGTARRVGGALEFAFRDDHASCGKLARSLPFRAITLGHVIIGVTAHDLAASRTHEWVHVRQYERWGPAFFLAYPASSLWQLLQGRDVYRDNHFEIEARVLSRESG